MLFIEYQLRPDLWLTVSQLDMFQWSCLLNASYRVGSHVSKAASFTQHLGYFAKPTTGWPSEFGYPIFPKFVGYGGSHEMIICTGLFILLVP